MEKISFIGLGSNVGDKVGNVRKAVSLLSRRVEVIAQSSLYDTSPVGFKEQDWFVNCVVSVKTDMDVSDLFLFLLEIEDSIGKDKEFENGPRRIDLDLLFYSDLVIESNVNGNALIVPHPRLHERKFVLVPLAEIDASFVHPVLGKNVSELLDEVKDDSEVKLS